ncbi:hypothetical protein DSM106972_061230 [Dulcicalothrix desertica PCC 7102]|uniref:Leucine rich repeat variant n=1 Tax=Dulcicalothrix desertica PCC 7102 TaxID=232991 RepID=A0A433V7M5_9CYAN|nr:hypothetical protein [Dulcicalothrix desertica]RUT02048.1 hypothetical protein DSM106972_061230 [Dulcicalothrix desertica PCC 7102]TWH53695.1 leucine rich repeat (LRR) protein [Dulcicalothrix desertica PCC 7102]
MDEKTTPQLVNANLANNLEQARIAAEDVSTDPELLQELARSQDKDTRRAVAANPNTPADVLLRLGAEFPTQLVENPVFSLLLLENPNLVAEIPLPTLRSILRLDNVPQFILEQAAHKADVEVQLALANNIQTSKKVLERLTQSRDAQVAESARLHVNFAGELTGYEEKAREVIQGNMSLPYRDERNILNVLAVLAQICHIPHYIIEYWVKNSGYGDLCSTLANSPATSPNILKQLACHQNSRIRYDVARNCHIPTDVLLQLINDCQAVPGLGSVRSGLAGNPNTPSDILESIAEENYSISREKVAQNPNTSLSFIQELINGTDTRTAQIATRTFKAKQCEYDVDFLSYKNTSHFILQKFIEKQPLVVAEHPNALPEWLSEFSKSPHEKIRKAVAQNYNTPTNILEQLADDDSWSVRWEIARNPNTPIKTIFKNLARDTSVLDTIGYQMSKQYERAEKDSILDILAEESTSSLETILQRLIQEGEQTARTFLASRVDLPTDLLTQLAQTGEYQVREAVAKNPNTPVESLADLANDKQYKVRLAVTQNLNTSTVVLEEFAKNRENELREKAMINPNLSKDSIQRILCGEYAADYLKINPYFIFNNPSCLNLVINYYTNYKSYIVTYIALLQPQISQEILQKKSLSISWLERFAVAQNLNTSLETLKKLTHDSNQLVCAAAKHSLKR